MRTKPAWGVLLLGALVILALLLSPLWLERFSPYIKEKEQESLFPDAFYLLSNEAQDLYTKMHAASPQMAIDFVAARLAAPVDIEEPNLPALDLQPSAVQWLLKGSFAVLDPIRGSAGTASLYRLSDGRMLVRLENLDAINGPDLHVLLSAYPNPLIQADLDQAPQLQIDLGVLKGNQGSQNYFVEDPAFNADNYVNGSVVLYSAAYQIIFSYATLAVPQGGS